MMTDNEKQEWVELQNELAETQAELEKLLEESEKMDKEFSEAFEQIMAAEIVDSDENWLMGIKFIDNLGICAKYRDYHRFRNSGFGTKTGERMPQTVKAQKEKAEEYRWEQSQ